ncbi:MAG: hypothetical protein A2511_09065 [Deltaproteobacteria bacterium RIFOXYD12_FULL_50_9]|nr:MAG: hypothetical protein A2511_09065 [Deltaproteobacteria bacterium RIFOXYD12_FULL_50_9]
MKFQELGNITIAGIEDNENLSPAMRKICCDAPTILQQFEVLYAQAQRGLQNFDKRNNPASISINEQAEFDKLLHDIEELRSKCNQSIHAIGEGLKQEITVAKALSDELRQRGKVVPPESLKHGLDLVNEASGLCEGSLADRIKALQLGARARRCLEKTLHDVLRCWLASNHTRLAGISLKI